MVYIRFGRFKFFAPEKHKNRGRVDRKLKKNLWHYQLYGAYHRKKKNPTACNTWNARTCQRKKTVLILIWHPIRLKGVLFFKSGKFKWNEHIKFVLQIISWTWQYSSIFPSCYILNSDEKTCIIVVIFLSYLILVQYSWRST